MASIKFKYNAFGLTYNDIINAFPGTVENDFDTNNNCGSRVIQKEMQLRESELLSTLNSSALNLMNELDWFAVDVTTVSGASQFVFPFVPDTQQDVQGYIYSKPCSSRNELIVSGTNCPDNRCGDFNICPSSTSLVPITITIDDDGDYIGTIDDIIDSDQELLIKYIPDKSLIDLPSLAAILKDMVVCSMGTGLYSAGSDTWDHVDKACERSTAQLAIINNNSWIPGEIKMLEFINPVIPSGIRSIKEWRN